MHKHQQDKESHGGMSMSYGRFTAMIATSAIVMFGLMYLNGGVSPMRTALRQRDPVL